MSDLTDDLLAEVEDKLARFERAKAEAEQDGLAMTERPTPEQARDAVARIVGRHQVRTLPPLCGALSRDIDAPTPPGPPSVPYWCDLAEGHEGRHLCRAFGRPVAFEARAWRQNEPRRSCSCRASNCEVAVLLDPSNRAVFTAALLATGGEDDMLAALVEAGVLREERCCDRYRGDYRVWTCAQADRECRTRLVTEWTPQP